MTVAVFTQEQAPSAAQLAAIHRLLEPEITKRGFVVAKDRASADYVMQVIFVPHTTIPHGGHVTFMDIVRNDRRQVRGGENPAAEASASALADLRKAISEVEWANAASK